MSFFDPTAAELNVAIQSPSGSIGFGEVPPGTRLAKDRPSGPEISFFESAVEAAAEKQHMPASTTTLGHWDEALHGKPRLTAEQVKEIAAFAEGKEGHNTPPFIPGITPAPSQIPNQFAPVPVVDPFGRLVAPQTPYVATAVQGVAQPGHGVGQAPVPAAAPVPAPPPFDYAEMIKPVLEAQQQQFAAMLAPMQQQAQQQQMLVNQLIANQRAFQQVNAPHIRAQEIIAAGLDPNERTHQQLYDQWQENQGLHQRLAAMEHELQYIRQTAQSHVSRATFEERIGDSLKKQHPNRDIPVSSIKHAAQLATTLAPSMGEDEAMRSALAGIMPLVAMLPEKQKAEEKKQAAVQPGQQPPPYQQLVHPGIAALSQMPQFQHMGLQQLAQVYQAMQVASLPGAGGGRNPLQPVNMNTVEAVLFN